MTDTDDKKNRARLSSSAREAMLERRLLAGSPPEALPELPGARESAASLGEAPRDLRHLLWCSIGGDESRDLSQLSVAETLPGGAAKILIAIADVDALVNQHTSLNPGADRLAIVIEMVFAGDGALQSSDLYGAQVRSQAKLAYNSVGGWLEGNGPMPPEIGTVSGLSANLRLQDRVALRVKTLRHQRGALDPKMCEPRPVYAGDEPKDLGVENRSRAKDIIEDFMLAASRVAARCLAANKVSSLRRAVRACQLLRC